MRLSRICKRLLSRQKRVLICIVCVLLALYIYLFPPTSEMRETHSIIDSTLSPSRPKSVDSADVWLRPRPLSELNHNVVPNLVFYIWCENRTFTFQDYLSVLSAWKLLEPESLEIHTGTDVQQDKYNNWLSVLNETIPSLVVRKIPIQVDQMCKHPVLFASEVLSDRGGMYLSFSTLLTRTTHHLRHLNFSVGFDRNGDVSFMSSRIKEPILRHVWNMTAFVKSVFDRKYQISVCPMLVRTHDYKIQVETNRTPEMCLTVPRDMNLKPLDLRTGSQREISVLESLFYDSEHKAEKIHQDSAYFQSDSSQTKAIPNIVHYIWFGSSEMSFRMYLSLLSSLHVAKADRVYIHTDRHLYGHYWNKMTSHPQVTVVYREAPREIFGHKILYSQHRSDIARADILSKYGGMYLDWDVLWLRSPADLLNSAHEAIVSFDHMPRPSYPDTINLGVLLAKPRSEFIRLWRAALKNYRSRDFFYNALELPYKVYERHPETLHVENRLQVMCFWLKCHPTFHPDFKNWQEEQPFDWRTDAYSIHFTHPDPDEYKSVVDLLNAKGTFADIGKFILREAGELD